MTKLKRGGVDCLFFGPKGVGKSWSMAYLCKRAYDLYDKEIYSNMPLSYNHTRFTDMYDFIDNDFSNGIVLFDDIERNASSKFISNKDKSVLLLATLDFGKRNLSLFSSTKRLEECDKTIRSITDYFIEVDIQLAIEPETEEEYESIKDQLEYCKIVNTVYDYIGNYHQTIEIHKLEKIKNIFDTEYHVEKLSDVGNKE